MDTSRTVLNMAAEETLDPGDWDDVQALSHRIVDDAVGYLRDVRSRPVWRDMPADVKQFFSAPLPRVPAPLGDVYGEVADNVMTYPMGNVHPRFWAWYMGSSNFTGAVGDFLAAIQGSNLGGGNHAAALMDQQVVNWCKEMMGFPSSASGTLVSGGSMANIIGLTVARNAQAGVDVRELGVAAIEKPLRFYGSDQLHSCHRKAMEALGLGHRALRRIPTDAELRIDLAALRQAIAEDRGHGISAGLRNRHGRHGEHRGHRRSARPRAPGKGRRPLVPCRWLRWCAHRHRTEKCISGLRDRKCRLNRARPP